MASDLVLDVFLHELHALNLTWTVHHDGSLRADLYQAADERHRTPWPWPCCPVTAVANARRQRQHIPELWTTCQYDKAGAELGLDARTATRIAIAADVRAPEKKRELALRRKLLATCGVTA